MIPLSQESPRVGSRLCTDSGVPEDASYGSATAYATLGSGHTPTLEHPC